VPMKNLTLEDAVDALGILLFLATPIAIHLDYNVVDYVQSLKFIHFNLSIDAYYAGLYLLNSFVILVISVFHIKSRRPQAVSSDNQGSTR
jgi:hypothetical protein